MSHTVYVSSQCPNCVRFLATLRRIPSLRNTHVVNIDTLAPEQRNKIEFVPTFVDTRGSVHTGAKAFDYLKEFDGEVELESAPLGGGSLAFGSLTDGEGLEYSGFYGEFTAPPL